MKNSSVGFNNSDNQFFVESAYFKLIDISTSRGLSNTFFTTYNYFFFNSGDPRRPYPTDVEMRIGLLGRPESAAIEISRSAQSSGERGVAAAAAAVVGTPGARTPSSYGPSGAGPMSAGAGPGPVHPQDFHHPSPQHHMGKDEFSSIAKTR